MGLFGFLKEENSDLQKSESPSNNVVNFDVNVPMVITTGSFSSDSIIYVTDDALSMNIVTDF